jgi:hypothetical protein
MGTSSSMTACVGNSCPGCASAQCLSSSRVVRQQPIQGGAQVLNTVVREQHVNQQQAPSIQEQHVIQEKHITKEQPILEKKIIHEQPIVQQRTIVHEKPVVHERTVVHKQEEVVHEKPMFQQAATQHVREAPTVVNEGTVFRQEQPVHKYDSSAIHTQQPLQQNIHHTTQQPLMNTQRATQPLMNNQTSAMSSNSMVTEPTVLHETVVGSPVYDKTKLANTTSTSRQEDLLRHQTDMNQGLAGENDRIAANLKAAAAEREILAHLDAAKAPGTATTAKVGKHTSSA